ncbi:hypothetical protein Dimus_036656 [Dionaea muscipula]
MAMVLGRITELPYHIHGNNRCRCEMFRARHPFLIVWVKQFVFPPQHTVDPKSTNCKPNSPDKTAKDKAGVHGRFRFLITEITAVVSLASSLQNHLANRIAPLVVM